MPHPPSQRAIPAAILATGVLAATAILLNAAIDSAPPTRPSTSTDFSVVARTPDDPANSNSTTP